MEFLPHPISKRPMPIIAVELPRQPDHFKIFEVTELCGILVTAETFRFQGTTQCYKCNRFGHTAKQCLSRARCLKCGKHHETRDCKLPVVKNPTCINCNAVGHTAAWRQCPSFPKSKEPAPKKPYRPAHNPLAPPRSGPDLPLGQLGPGLGAPNLGAPKF